jgi:hypothetical protein
MAESRTSDTLPHELGRLLPAVKEQRSRAQCQPIRVDVHQALLVDTDPVGKQAELHVMDDGVPLEFIPEVARDLVEL